MQLEKIKSGWKPVTIALGVVAGGTVSLYSDIDQFSHVYTVINNHITSKYLLEVNNPEESRMNDKILFDNLYNSWRKKTRFISSIDGIIEQQDFQAIVSMGSRAVPFIGETIEVEPSTLVWALNLIYGNDKFFKITSPNDSNYNCIAWAYQIKGRWMWPPAGSQARVLDAVTFWPDENASEEVESFVDAFRLKGYEKCDTPDFEHGYRKIALYVTPGTTRCTHAARQLSTGLWTSKLGESFDIQHGTPFTIEGDVYGEVYCYMKRVFE